jgi:hypothetical protein
MKSLNGRTACNEYGVEAFLVNTVMGIRTMDRKGQLSNLIIIIFMYSKIPNHFKREDSKVHRKERFFHEIR